MSQITSIVPTERLSLVRRVWRFIGSWALAESIVAIVGIILGLSLTSVIAKVPLLGCSALLLVAVAIAKLQRERQQDERESERDAQLKRMEDALSHPLIEAPPLPLPHVAALTPIVRQAYQDADGVVRLGRGPVETGMQTMRYAILAPFKNTAKAGVQTRNAKDVSASVIFKDADGWPITGAWLESATHTVDIPMGAPEQRVILVFAEEGGGAFILDDERQGAAGKITRISFCAYPKQNEPPPPDFAIRVELMESGHLVLTAEYNVRITLPYPQASLISVSYPQHDEAGEAARAINESKANDLRIKALELEVAERKERLNNAQRESGAQAVRLMMADAERRNPTPLKPELVVGYDQKRGYDHAALADPNRDPRWNLHPFYIRNDGKATAVNISIKDTTVGARAISFALEGTSLKEGGDTSLSIYCNGDRVDKRIVTFLSGVIEEAINAGADGRIEKRIPVRISYKDRSLIEYHDHFDIITGASPCEGG